MPHRTVRLATVLALVAAAPVWAQGSPPGAAAAAPSTRRARGSSAGSVGARCRYFGCATLQRGARAHHPRDRRAKMSRGPRARHSGP